MQSAFDTGQHEPCVPKSSMCWTTSHGDALLPREPLHKKKGVSDVVVSERLPSA